MSRRKLTDDQVNVIRFSLYTQQALAAEFGVSTSTISLIQRNQAYRTVPWPSEAMESPCRCPRCAAERRHLGAGQWSPGSEVQ